MTRFQRRLVAALFGAALLIAGAVGWVVWRNLPVPDVALPSTADPADPVLIARGEYLAIAGNCGGCHTARGGLPYAGGRGIDTPFGVVHATNLTPDPVTGIGRWTSADFWRALHEGRTPEGRLLYPAFPYPNYTRVSRADADAIFAYLRSLPAVQQVNRAHELRFPYRLQAALAVWRALYFTPAGFRSDTTRSNAWNRGDYLVNGLGHCMACHARRNTLGQTLDGGGSLLPDGKWFAPSLHSPREAGAMAQDAEAIVALLRDGIAGDATVMGPMAEVVYTSTQHLLETDLRAMAEYLQSLPPETPGDPKAARAERPMLQLGRRLYAEHCADCHGRRGEGNAGVSPALAGNRAVTMPVAQNVVQAILRGGFPPSTAGNPRPYGMPPFDKMLSTREIAALATYIRQSWGNEASVVWAFEVEQAR